MTELEIRGLRRRFGGVAAVDGVDLDVPAGAVTALIGPNGAGKTTLFHCVTGLDAADGGTVTLGGRRLSGLPPHARARAGMAWTFQRIELFAGLTVAENVRVGAENRRGRPLAAGLLGLPDRRRGEVRATVSAVLDRLGLTALADAPAGTLPTGTMRLVEVGRAVAAEPSALLLDEPASGLDDDQIARLVRVLRGLAGDGMAVLVVEHDLRFVGAVADSVRVMVGGRIVLSGRPDEVLAAPLVREIYAGEE
ncbi:high-affinity branched-chain amino acid ABC transporter ATP-binding protein LivG [Catenulispora yoronensis]|uniref:High-affinity branched-chain amino acid ABC transporter ATP-binding protein LivG n=1 Tax=Catenulispora yoronensis TaxID=450799 RepID=A0ABP5F8E4_9ACTN